MKFEELDVAGCFAVELEPHVDERGFFARAYDVAEFEEHGLEPVIAQINIARSKEPGTIRGIHWQKAPHAEAKFVRCISGSVFDVCVDVRPESPTRGKWVGLELDADSHRALYVPAGCGHAHQTLEPDSAVTYSASVPYAPGFEDGARWDDPILAIDWPYPDDPVVSEKDANWPDLDFD